MVEFVQRLWNDPKTARKFIAALLGTLITALTVGVIPGAQWAPVVVAFATAMGVYAVPNKEEE